MNSDRSTSRTNSAPAVEPTRSTWAMEAGCTVIRGNCSDNNTRMVVVSLDTLLPSAITITGIVGCFAIERNVHQMWGGPHTSSEGEQRDG